MYDVLSACICVYHVQCWNPKEGVEYAVTEVTDSYEPLSAGCWELMNMVLCQSSSALNHRPVSPVHPSLEAMV